MAPRGRRRVNGQKGACVTAYEYGVAHVEGGEIIEMENGLSLDQAENTLVACNKDWPAEKGRCYAVRRPVYPPPEWERLPARADSGEAL